MSFEHLLCAKPRSSFSWYLLSNGVNGLFKSSQQIKGHEGAQQAVRDLGWHCPAEPRIGQNREVLGEAVVSLEAGEGMCAILWVSWAAVSLQTGWMAGLE